MIQLKNEYLTVEVAEMGAELQSIKDADGREYLWQGDAKYWPRRAPILFPIVCSVENDTYEIDGHEYHLPRHGFARDTAFTLIKQGPGQATFALHESEETLKCYPFRFNLAVSYKLDDNKIRVVWHVENTDTREIHFQIGGHPAFNAPGCEKGQEVKGALWVDNPGKLRSLKSYIDGSHEMTETDVASENGIIPFNDEFFANDSVKLHDCQTHAAALLNPDGTPAVTLSYRCPVIAFWSPYKTGAPFVCIEPWYGLGSPRGYDGPFAEKPLMNHLLPGASFMSEYVIAIGTSEE